MTRRKKIQLKRIPKFANEQEAAVFWDTHSPMDYPEEFKKAEVKFSRPLIKRGLTVKLSDDTINELTKVARAQGIGPSTLVRMWLLQHMKELRSHQNHR